MPALSHSIATHFASLPEPRRRTVRKHPLLNILFIALCSLLSGADTFTDMVQWARNGLSAARSRGRPKVLSDDQRKMAQALRDDPSHSIKSNWKTRGISRTTFYRYTQDYTATGGAGSKSTSVKHAK